MFSTCSGGAVAWITVKHPIRQLATGERRRSLQSEEVLRFVPCRDSRAPACLAGRLAPRAVETRGPRMEGLEPLQQGKDAVLHRQRSEGLLSRLLLRQARRHLHLRHGDGRALVSG